MTVLVATASKHAGTLGIAEAIAAELRMMRFDVDIRTIDNSFDVASQDAVVLGSAVYMGKWLPEATAFVDRNRERLTSIPVWLFSSGPLGTEVPKPTGDPAGLEVVIRSTAARDHRVFAGKLDPHRLGVVECLTAKLVRAPEGDFRDWEAIRDWAREIGNALTPALVNR